MRLKVKSIALGMVFDEEYSPTSANETLLEVRVNACTRYNDDCGRTLLLIFTQLFGIPTYLSRSICLITLIFINLAGFNFTYNFLFHFPVCTGQ